VSAAAHPQSAAKQLHGLPPLLNAQTRVLVLGSFPSVASLHSQQYYAHPRNQLWKLVFQALSADSPEFYCASSYEIRSAHLLTLGVGLWDVYARCERQGSLDSAIRHPQPNDLASLRQRCPQLQAIAHNGGESAKHAPAVHQLLNLLHPTLHPIAIHTLPSSSPAHASWSFARKLAAWQAVLQPYGL
jgi:hypoxanthine-DNA glycosylase